MSPILRSLPLLAIGAFAQNPARTPALTGFQHAWVKDLNGDGVIETGYIRLDRDWPATPQAMQFRLQQNAQAFHGIFGMQPADMAVLPGDRKVLRLDFRLTFPAHMTGFVEAESKGVAHFAADSGAFAGVKDSAGPVLVDAVFKPADAEGGAGVALRLSEAVEWAPAHAGGMLLFKRGSDGAVVKAEVADVSNAAPGDPWLYTVRLEAGAWTPSAADSVALPVDGAVADANGNRPVKLRYFPMNGARPYGPELLAAAVKPASARPKAKNPSGAWVFRIDGRMVNKNWWRMR